MLITIDIQENQFQIPWRLGILVCRDLYFVSFVPIIHSFSSTAYRQVCLWLYVSQGTHKLYRYTMNVEFTVSC